MLANLSIKTRLIFILCFMSTLLVGGAVIGLYGIGENEKGVKSVYQDRTVPIGRVGTVATLVLNNRIAIAAAVVNPTPEVIAGKLAQVEKNIDEITRVWNAYLAAPLQPEEKNLADRFAADRKAFVVEGLRPAVAALREHDIQAAGRILVDKIDPLYEPMAAALDALSTWQLNAAKQEFEQARDRSLTIRNFAVVSLVVGLALAAWLGLVLIRAITRRLDTAVRFARSIAEGDLTQQIDIRSTDEIGQLLQALKDMNASLANIVGQVRTGTETIAVASREIAAGNADLSARTESQASSLEETASSMEELTGTVKQNAEQSHHASKLVLSTADIAVNGGEVVGKVIQTMASINDSSRKIADIIGVIDGIAFQTNILALNAAVEAARAGEQGRGFAVVASEVRSLAQRSAGAAKEIKTLIGDSVEQVDAGRKLVDEAGEAMDDIVTSVQLVADIISGTATASQEQSAGIDQVNQAIGQMDEITQQNAALVEQAAAASESLQEQAARLAEAVSVFRLGGMSGQRAALPVLRDVAVLPQLHPKAAPAARPKKLAAAGGGNEEWEEF